MSEVNLTIDGKKVTAEEGMTLLEAARNVGVDIPTLCHHEKLAPYGACRLCTVEITNGRRSRLVASCVYPVEEGLTVETESAPVVKIRKMLLQLAWARAPGVKAIRDYGIRYGITEVQAIREYGIPYNIKTTKFDTEPTFCILCGLCVRYCAEVKQKHAIGFIGRGTEREVVFFPETAREECPKCKECHPLCPTGALASYYDIVQALNSE